MAEDAAAEIVITNGVTEVDTGTGTASGSADFVIGANTIVVEVTVGAEVVEYTVVLTKSA